MNSLRERLQYNRDRLFNPLSTNLKTEPKVPMITVVNNYFTDLNAAIAAGLFPTNAKPKKTALYEAIAAHNAGSTANSEHAEMGVSAKSKRRTPTENIENLRTLSIEVEQHGIIATAQRLNTSRGRLEKLVKAYKLLSAYPAIKEAFVDKKFTYSYLCETAVRRDRLAQFQTILNVELS